MSHQTIPDFLLAAARRLPEKIGLVFQERSYTYREILRRVSALRASMDGQVHPGEVVALLLPNGPEFIFGYFGILKAGCTVLLLPANISDENLQYQMKKTRARFIVSSEPYKAKLQRTGLWERLKHFPVAEILEGADVSPASLATPDGISTIIFTSGTTGEPKGVALRHRHVVAATKNICTYLQFQESDIDVNASSLSHSFGLGHIHCIFSVGGTVHLFRDTIDLRKILRTIVLERATTFGAVPAVLRLLVQHYPDELRACDLSLRFIQTNTSPLERSLVENIISCLPTTDFQYYYGLSEASRSTFITLNQQMERLASVGKPSPNVEVKVIGDSGERVVSGEIGEICLRGAHVIDSYFENREASKQIQDGWLHTGDVGFFDEEGYLYCKGRKGEMMNISGEKVAPEEIEQVVKLVSGVTDAAAIGIPDPVFGEVPKVFVSVEDPAFETQKIIVACKATLESYKVPRAVEIIETIPRTANGKLCRNALKQRDEEYVG
ncbi:hypothetical protein A3I45_04030 [Candidatus Uhrbacteria bacterium RIFCSPLOWO2_02_FULL_53_10]|uniref:AMP-dependent synthetase n=3 Tax=Candidatus Uhriibacteriota TaxID=1752732 RepID=A0A1F7VHV3_9BACT|nr:MAG: hypothetical protein A3I45_04030 [Candidatus Uhrbacteria bacterium RIFCSPLOWO2_02_FULL_53_10]